MLGVDIINVKELPIYGSKLEKRFFVDNFTKNEISYLDNKQDKQKICALIFSLKESIVKCDSTLIDVPFNKIEIIFIDSIPQLKNYTLSYSNINSGLICTVALKNNS